MIRAAVGFGGNLGRPEVAFAAALAALAADPAVEVCAVSSLWRSAPWGGVPQPEFLNGVALLETDHAPRALLRELLAIETRAGRVRDGRWGPRTLDLDLLFHGDEKCSEEGLWIPHPRMEERSFVLAPLAEVAPTWRHPGSGRTTAEALDRLRASSVWTPCARVEGSRLGAAPTGETACPR